MHIQINGAATPTGASSQTQQFWCVDHDDRIKAPLGHQLFEGAKRTEMNPLAPFGQYLSQAVVLTEEKLTMVTSLLQGPLTQQQLGGHTTNDGVAVGVESFQPGSPERHSSAKATT